MDKSMKDLMAEFDKRFIKVDFVDKAENEVAVSLQVHNVSDKELVTVMVNMIMKMAKHNEVDPEAILAEVIVELIMRKDK